MASARERPEIRRAPRALAIVPARLASQRLPRKMLLVAGGRALFAHTAHNVLGSGAFARVIVATDSAEIAEEARREGLEAALTSVDHGSGSDRAAEAWTAIAASGESADVIVNVQGDEPELDPADLRALVRAFADPSVEAATLAVPLADERDAALPSVVKVVRDRHGDALYFSRAPIPARGHASAGPARESPAVDPRERRSVADSAEARAAAGATHARAAGGDRIARRADEIVRRDSDHVHRRHVGVYAYRPEALLEFCALPRGVLERHESLEQLRWLEAGRKMRVIDAARAPQGIDTMQDFEEFSARVRERAASAGALAPRDARGAGRSGEENRVGAG